MKFAKGLLLALFLAPFVFPKPARAQNQIQPGYFPSDRWKDQLADKINWNHVDLDNWNYNELLYGNWIVFDKEKSRQGIAVNILKKTDLDTSFGSRHFKFRLYEIEARSLKGEFEIDFFRDFALADKYGKITIDWLNQGLEPYALPIYRKFNPTADVRMIYNRYSEEITLTPSRYGAVRRTLPFLVEERYIGENYVDVEHELTGPIRFMDTRLDTGVVTDNFTRPRKERLPR